MGFLGMDAGGGPNLNIALWVRVGQVEGAVHGVGAVAYADGEEGVDACCAGVGEDGGEVGVVVEMAMGVDEMHGLLQGTVRVFSLGGIVYRG